MLQAFWLFTGSVLGARQKWDGYHGVGRECLLGQGQGSTVNFSPQSTPQLGMAFGYMADPLHPHSKETFAPLGAN